MAKKVKKKVKAKAIAKRAAPKKRSPKRSAKKKPAIIFTKAVQKPRVVTETQERPLPESQVQNFREILTQKRDDLLAVVQRKKEQEIQVGEEEMGDEADIATRSVE